MQWVQVGIVLLAVGMPISAWGAGPRALPEGELPKDQRLGDLKDLDGYFPFAVPKTLEDWNARRSDVGRQLLLANGLWPLPERGPIQATVHDPVEREGYTVSRVFFESLPGLYVTGSLYTPTEGEGPFPAILSAHGHFADGRFHVHGDAAIKEELESGGEKFENSGRYPLQARCVHLVRMGCIVFEYDMVGYADSAPLTFELAHRFGTQRPELSKPDHWGMFSAQSEMRLINALGLQTWNSMRAFDWFASLENVDSQRIGVTGASGGGTQTFLLAAVEPRIAAAFPAVMVSTAMQGGCTCENASYLRVRTGNIELAGLIAPRPLGMSGANDWTIEIETKGLPELKTLYGMYEVPENVEARYFDFPHNFNYVSRAMMYDFFRRHFDLKDAGPESDYQPLTREELTVWSEKYPKPATDEAAEVQLMRGIAKRDEEMLAALKPTDAATLENYHHVVGGAFETMVGRSLADVGEVNFKPTAEEVGEQTVGILEVPAHGEALPTLILSPVGETRGSIIWPHVNGKAGLLDDAGKPLPAVQKLVDAGYRVLTADLLGQGEFTADGKAWSQAPVVKNPREFAGYTLGYNDPLPSRRAHDVLALIQHESQVSAGKPITVVGFDAAAAWAALAASQAGDAVARAVIAPGEFRFAKVTEIRDPNLLPGAIKYGDLNGIVALLATKQVYAADGVAEGLGAAAFQAAGKADALTQADKAADREAAAVEWITSK